MSTKHPSITLTVDCHFQGLALFRVVNSVTVYFILSKNGVSLYLIKLLAVRASLVEECAFK